MEVNHPTQTHKQAQHDAIAFACGRFSALDCFMIISLSLSRRVAGGGWWNFCVLSAVVCMIICF